MLMTTKYLQDKDQIIDFSPDIQTLFKTVSKWVIGDAGVCLNLVNDVINNTTSFARTCWESEIVFRSKSVHKNRNCILIYKIWRNTYQSEMV